MSFENNYKFIVIDDHPLIRDGIVDFIRTQTGFQFLGDFKDTRSVINSTFKEQPDVIILDLNLAGADGSKDCPVLKQKFKGCKVVAFTQYVGKERELMKLDFDGYVLKSERDSLIRAIQSVLKGEKFFLKSEKLLSSKAADFEAPDSFLKTKTLTPREIEISKFVVQNYTNKEIANEMYISEETVETHKKHIRQKLGVTSKRDLYAILKTYL